MSTREDTIPRGLVVGVLVLTFVVLALGGAVVAFKLRPAPMPENATDRNVVLWLQAVDDTPDDPSAHTGLGLALIQAQRPDAAREAFEEAIALDEGAWMAKFQLGILLSESDASRAVGLLQDAGKLAPEQERVAPLIAAGDLLLAIGDPESAKAAFNRSLVYNPFTIEGHVGLAASLEALGDTKAALREYEEAGTFDPNSAEIAAAIERLSS